MDLVCPNCHRKIASFNFNHCLYCKKVFDDTLIKEMEKEKSKNPMRNIEKEFIQWKFQYSIPQKTKKTISVLRASSVLLLIIMGILLLYSMLKFISFSRSFQSPFSTILYAAFPIIFILLGLIGYIVYKLILR